MDAEDKELRKREVEWRERILADRPRCIKEWMKDRKRQAKGNVFLYQNLEKNVAIFTWKEKVTATLSLKECNDALKGEGFRLYRFDAKEPPSTNWYWGLDDFPRYLSGYHALLFPREGAWRGWQGEEE